jgi:PAS domain S-box-containing protein
MPGEGELLRTLVDTISAMVAFWDSTSRCRFANRAYERWFGVSPESLIGKHISELLGPPLYALNLPYIEGALRGEPQEFEREIPDPAGGPPRRSLANYIPHVVDGRVCGFFVLVTDISPIKRAELSWRESEERFRLTLDEAPIGMALVAPDGRFTRVNRALCEIVGYTAEELTGLTFQAITHPDDLDADLALAGRLERGEIPRYRLGKRYIRKDGTTVHIMLHGSALRGPDGAPIHYIAQIEDVTEQLRAEEAIRHARERFELALEGADLASWDWNIETGEVTFNSRWATMRGYRPEEIRPHVDSWTSGIHPGDRARVENALADVLAGLAPEYACEHRVRTKSGQWIWILDRGKVFARDEHGHPIRMAGTELDITERKRAERDQSFLAEVGPVLASSLDYEKTIERVAQLAVRELADLCIVDVVEDGTEVRRLRVASRDPSKASLCDLLTRVALDRSRPYLLRTAFETQQPFLLQQPSAETIASFAQGEEHHRALRAAEIHSMVAVPLIANARFLGVVALISSSPSRIYGPADVRLAEELAQRAALSIANARLYDQARRATKARDDILGIVAHDLRNPLHRILTQTNLLRLRRERGEQGAQEAAEAVIERATRQMNRLIQDLLDVTRIEAGRLSVETASVAAREVVVDSVEAQMPLASTAEIDLHFELDETLPNVCADRDRLFQVFENLIANALKFTPAGGRITVGAAPRADDVLFWVADTGCGVAETDLPHLFDRFWQVRRADRRGAGLGLPIVKGVIESHGGRIWVESAPGRGTTVRFTIPRAASAHEQPRHSAGHPP